MLRRGGRRPRRAARNQSNLFGGVAEPAQAAAAAASSTGRSTSACRTSSRRSASISRPIRSMPMASAEAARRRPRLPICRSGCGMAAQPRVKLAGIVIGKQERTSAKGNRFAFVQMSDQSGVFEVTLFSEVLATSRDLLASGKPLLITADARLEDDAVKLLAQTIQPLDVAAASAPPACASRSMTRQPCPACATSSRARSAAAAASCSTSSSASRRVRRSQLPGAFMISPDTRARVAGLAGVTRGSRDLTDPDGCRPCGASPGLADIAACAC